MPCPHEQALKETLTVLDETCFDIIETITHTQGPARAVQMVGMACANMADHPDTDEHLRKMMADIADNLGRYAETILEHMGEYKP